MKDITDSSVIDYIETHERESAPIRLNRILKRRMRAFLMARTATSNELGG